MYEHAVSHIPVPGHPIGPPPADFASDPSPRRKIVRRLKESLVKCIILTGVPRVIEASFALKVATEKSPGGVDHEDSFVREGLDSGSGTYGLEGNRTRGLKGLDRVYREQYPPIRQKMQDGLKDICKSYMLNQRARPK